MKYFIILLINFSFINAFETINSKFMAIQEVDGEEKLVAAKSSNNAYYNIIGVVRYNNNGTLDTTFNRNSLNPGFILQDIYGDFCEANSVAIDSKNRIVIGGVTINPQALNSVFMLARYNEDGTIDETFNPTGVQARNTNAIVGVVTTDVAFNIYGVANVTGKPNDSEIISILVDDTNNKITASGYYIIDDKLVICVARYNEDGSLDETFNPTGFHTTNVIARGIVDFNIAKKSLFVQSMSPDAKNRIVMTGCVSNVLQDPAGISEGSVSENLDNINLNTLVMRLNTDGSLDQTFNPQGETPGMKFINFVNPSIGQSLIADVDNSISVCGLVAVGAVVFFKGHLVGKNENFINVFRLNEDGSLSDTFSDNGVLTKAAGISTGFISYLNLDKDDNLVLCFYQNNSSTVDQTLNTLVVVKIDPDGTVNTNFSPNDSICLPQIQNDFNNVPPSTLNQSIENAADFISSFFSPSDGLCVIGVVLQNSVYTPLTDEILADMTTAFVLDSEGKIIFGGFVNSARNNNYALFQRFDSDGEVDTTFNSEGIDSLVPGRVILNVFSGDPSANLKSGGTSDNSSSNYDSGNPGSGSASGDMSQASSYNDNDSNTLTLPFSQYDFKIGYNDFSFGLNEFKISGIGYPGASCNIFANDEFIGKSSVSGQGKWDYSFDTFGIQDQKIKLTLDAPYEDKFNHWYALSLEKGALDKEVVESGTITQALNSIDPDIFDADAEIYGSSPGSANSVFVSLNGSPIGYTKANFSGDWAVYGKFAKFVSTGDTVRVDILSSDDGAEYVISQVQTVNNTTN